MKMSSLLPRALLTMGAFWGVTAANTMHEIVSPLISGPMAAQQLSDSNTAYVGAQVASRMFNGSGMGLVADIVLLAALVAIWYTPIRNIFSTSQRV